jgi:hypothetical protein
VSRSYRVVNSEEQFLLYIGGCCGTGKTQIINAILFTSELLDLRDKCYVTASTGTAASHIKGEIVHSAVGITGKDKSSILVNKLSTLQNLLHHTDLFIMDEISMVSTKLLGQIDKNCAQIFELPTTGSAVLGGIPVVLFFGDFYQFPSVGGDPLWKPKKPDAISDLEREGLNLWRCFKLVVILTECLRQKGDIVYQGILERARNVSLTQEDVDILNNCTVQYCKSNGKLLLYLSITTTNSLRHELNFLHVVDFDRASEQKVYIFAGSHKPVAFKTSSSKDPKLFQKPTDISFLRILEIQDTNELKGSGFLLYAKGMPVMCLSNVSTRSGVVNGMCGTATCVVPNPEGKWLSSIFSVLSDSRLALFFPVDDLFVLCDSPPRFMLVEHNRIGAWPFTSLSTDLTPLYPIASRS